MFSKKEDKFLRKKMTDVYHVSRRGCRGYIMSLSSKGSLQEAGVVSSIFVSCILQDL